MLWWCLRIVIAPPNRLAGGQDQVLGRPRGRTTGRDVLVRRAAFVGLNTILYSLLLGVESEGECKLIVCLEAIARIIACRLVDSTVPS